MGRPSAEFLRLLTEHGVPEKGARIYLAASRSGSRTASELARIATLHRVEAYRFIRELCERGLLEATGGRPKRFAALPPEELVDRWIRENSESLARLKGDRESLLTGWHEEGIDLAIGGPDASKFVVLESAEAIRRLLAKRLAAAERQILVTVGPSGLASLMDSGTDRVLREASRRGVRVRIVTEVHRAHLAEIQHFSTFAEVRHAPTPVTHRSVVIDRTGTLVFVSGGNGVGREEPHVALWSGAPAVVDLNREYHRRLWVSSVRADNRLVEIEAPGSPALSVTPGKERIPFRRLQEITALGMEATGTKELRMTLPALIEGVADQLGRQIAREIEGSTAEEVARSLSVHYSRNAPGRLEILRPKPLTLRVSSCFACTSGSPEIGRVLCPRIFRSVLETRLGSHWEVSKPDPTRHASRGCLFTVTAA